MRRWAAVDTEHSACSSYNAERTLYHICYTRKAARQYADARGLAGDLFFWNACCNKNRRTVATHSVSDYQKMSNSSEVWY